MSKHKRARRPLAAVAAVLAVAASTVTVSVYAYGDEQTSAAAIGGHDDEEHDLLSAKELTLRENRVAAVDKVLQGEATAETKGSSKRIEYAEGKYSETSRTTDRVFVLPVEFGDAVDTTYGGLAGPSHNEIAEPDRSVDTSTVWTEDYSPAYYQRQLFGTASAKTGDTLKSYYLRQSSGAYELTGTVQEWTRVDYSISHYGTDACKKNGASISTYYCNEQLTTDGLNAWYEGRLAAGQTKSEIDKYLASYDMWDRNDFDADGIFNEPDGYLDRVMITFAGESQTNGGGVNGTNAIGAHRGTVSYLQDDADTLGPDNGNLAGGSEVGDSGIWANDYTMTNENRGLGTIAHEYGHDLGLPDLYDTSGGENSTGFWTVMSNGSLLTDDEQLSAHPGDLGAWSKLQLGWLDYETAEAATASTHTLNALSVDSSVKGAEALVVSLPDDVNGKARYYIVENRQYVGDDRYLENGPYNLGWASTYPKKKERLSYEEGVMIWYWNTAYANNRTKTNAGYGRILPLDSHAEPALDTTGAVVRNRLQSYDAPFGLKDTTALTFHLGGVEATIPSHEGVAVFDDINGTYHYDTAPYGSSYDADSGTTVTVRQEYRDGRVKIAVGASE
ncbi:immune inhibitor A domain-containing protein [Streptomyces sp. NBC_00620]|uniref:immune inhibitor A domain-containing protein n=1 Tax=Streptomyces sp. NBC_00620 TaxID=2903666 RepID=UPI00224CFC31|nr:immune inhibitor A domain-containing protein [Streptomyces sp. NBC_00620]MCX4978347.1 immune inhibitor A [Streptomyces sp. NBC_00620]